MWQNVKYYVLAYAIMVGGALASSVFQLLGEQFPAGHPVGTIAANLSGVTIGGMIMVIGFLKDARVEDERKRTAAAEARVERERERAAAAEERPTASGNAPPQLRHAPRRPRHAPPGW